MVSDQSALMNDGKWSMDAKILKVELDLEWLVIFTE